MKTNLSKYKTKKNAKRHSKASRNSLKKTMKKTMKKTKKSMKLHGGSEITYEQINAAINKIIDPSTDFKNNFNSMCRDDKQISILFQNANYCDLAAINKLNKVGTFRSLYQFIKNINDGTNGPDIDDTEIAMLSQEINEYSCTNRPTNPEHIELLNNVADKLKADNAKIIDIIQSIIAKIPSDYFKNQVVIDDEFKAKINIISIDVCKNIIKMYLGLENSDDCDIVYKLNNLFELLNFFMNEHKRRPEDEKNKQILGVIIELFGELLTPFINKELGKYHGINYQQQGGATNKEIAINAAICIVCGIVIIGLLVACICIQINIDPSIFWYRSRPALIGINL